MAGRPRCSAAPGALRRWPSMPLSSAGGVIFAGDAGDLVVGWPRQADFLRAKYNGTPLWRRQPAAAWRGRTQDPEHPWRDELRWVKAFQIGGGSCAAGPWLPGTVASCAQQLHGMARSMGRYPSQCLFVRVEGLTWAALLPVNPQRLDPPLACCRRRFAACPRQLRSAGRAEDAALFDLDTPNVTLANTCDFRCRLHKSLPATAMCIHREPSPCPIGLMV
jgi:hypothetical protein